MTLLCFTITKKSINLIKLKLINFFYIRFIDFLIIFTYHFNYIQLSIIMQSENPFETHISELKIEDKKYRYFDLQKLNDKRVAQLPISIKVLLQCAMRNCNGFSVKSQDIQKIIDWKNTSTKNTQIPFKPSRVILQDLTGVPLVVDLAGMRDAVARLGGDASKVNPQCPVDLVIDHSVQVDFARTPQSLKQNEQKQFQRNRQRFQFLKWGQSTFQNFSIVPPGFGIVHQVNLQYLARVVFDTNGLLYPDSVVGTDSHTTMINGLGVVGWGVGGIEAQAVMLGQCTAMVLPQVIGFKLTGELPKQSTATDLVLLCTKMLRQKGVVDKFVQFFGPGVKSLSLADRATISNMAPQYGATIGLFPVDQRTLQYLQQTGRSTQKINIVKQYLKKQGLFKDYQNDPDLTYTSVLQLDLSKVQPCVSGPKRPHDYVALNYMKQDWNNSLIKQVGFKGFGLKAEQVNNSSAFKYNGKQYQLKHGSVVIAAITSCTNTSNPGVMLAAALLCKNAYQRGIRIPSYIKTSLSPGSQAVSRYYELSGLTKYLNQMGFYHAGYGCMTCIGNSGQIDKQIEQAIKAKDICAASVLSGNRNFQGRVHPATKANFLASPPLVVAFAIAGTVNIDFQKQPLAKDKDGKDVYLHQIWPSKEQILKIQLDTIKPEIFKQTYSKVSSGTQRWNQLDTKKSVHFEWNQKSTYIHDPPFFKSANKQLTPIPRIQNAHVLALFGDSITTDHISPAGNISVNSPAARFLKERGIEKKDFNTYGARRGNDLIMARGTFANIRIINKMMKGQTGPKTIHVPTGEVLSIFDAAEKYQKEGHQLIIIGGKQYGSGSSRDWAAKGPYLQGVKAVIAQSFQRIHRSNLIGMGILPLTFLGGENSDTHGLTGEEKLTIGFDPLNIKVNEQIEVKLSTGKSFKAIVNLRTQVQISYYKNGGVLPYVLRKEVQH